MPLTSAFTPPGHFAFSSKPSHGQSIYETLRANFGDVFLTDFDGLQQARLYAQAMCLASSQYQLDRAVNNRTPRKATELLGVLEHDYQVIPTPRATLEQRRAYLTAFQKITRGNRREAMEDALRILLGTDFIELRNTLRTDIVATPASTPGSVGVFAAAGTKKKVFQIDGPVSLVGVQVVAFITALGGTEFPLAGETYCIDPDPRRNIEQITIVRADPIAGTIVTTFAKAHEWLTLGVRPHPYWISNQRVDTVVVTLAAATDPETRRKINEIMARVTRGVSIWQIIHNEGFFTSDDPVLGLPDCTPVS